MRDFLKFLQASHFFFLFLLLETISIFLSVRNNEKQKVFISSSNIISGYILEKTSNISNYFYLKEQNNLLIAENKELKNHLGSNKTESFLTSKSIENYGYYYRSAKVIKNSIYKPNNIITLNKGKKDGILKDMAVVSSVGVVGIVINTSNHYCTVIPLLNTKLRINAKIKRTDFFGTLHWDGKDYRYSTLSDIPDHTSLYKGDRIVTAGYSSIFPEGIPIGEVESFEKLGSFYKIKVKLNQDFNNIRNVYIIDFINKKEINKLIDSTNTMYNFNNIR